MVEIQLNELRTHGGEFPRVNIIIFIAGDGSGAEYIVFIHILVIGSGYCQLR